MSKIAIDLGHGVTYDRGAADGLIKEEVIVDAVGKLVIDYLRGRGHEVIETRPESATGLPNSLIKRVDKANEYQVDLFVSIHANAGNGVGTEVFTHQGKEIIEARNVLNNLVNLGFVNRGIKGTGLYVTHYTDAPAMLIEICFTDTHSDVELYNEIGAERIANAIVNGITGDEVIPMCTEPSKASVTINASDVTEDSMKVSALQELSNEILGLDLSVDNSWGPCTDAAVRELPICGIPYHNVKLTKWVQAVLGIEVDGIFLGESDAAVKSWQKAYNLKIDGIVGYNTYKSLALN